MGHLVNPTALRLRFFCYWHDTWSTAYLSHYAEILHTTLSIKSIVSYYLENMVTDRFSILYSHISVFETAYNAKVCVYFYDGFTERKIQRLIFFVKKFNWRKNKLEFRLKRKFMFFLGTHFRRRFLNRWGFYNYLALRKVIFLFFFLFNYLRRVMSVWMKKIFHRFYFKTFLKFWMVGIKCLKKSIKKRKLLYKMKSLNSLVFIRIYLTMFAGAFKKKILTERRLSVQKMWPKFNLFFYILNYVYSFWTLRFHYLQLLLIQHKIAFSFKHTSFLNLLLQTDKFVVMLAFTLLRTYLVYFRQRLFFQVYYNLMKPILQHISSLPIKLEFFGLDNDMITAQFLTRFLTRKIEMNFSLKEIFKPISRELKIIRYTTKMVRAFKIQFLGRITRRDRARISWILYGSVPYSTITSYVEHAIYIGILRNGTCCLRIWLVRPYSLGNYHNVYRYILSEAILEKMLFSRMRPFIYKSDTSMKKRSLIYLYK